MKRKKIAYCIPSLYISGGMERVLSIKANYFADVLGYEIYIILTDGKNKKPYYRLSPLIHVINLDINFDKIWNKSLFLKAIIYFHKQRIYRKRLKECLLQIRPGITVSMLRREINFINSIKDGSIKIGEIHVNRSNFRDMAEESGANFIKRILSKLWMIQLVRELKKLSVFVSLTNEDKAKWIELNNAVVINNPLSFFPDKASDCCKKEVIAVGRYIYQKGFDLLIEAWEIVSKKHPDWILKIYGEGDRKIYLNRTKELNIQDSCVLESAVTNIADKYTESSIFVLSSRFEGLPMVLGEVMSCGVPPVAFTCPCGPKDIIKDGIDGLLVENGNIKELANKICYLIEHEDIRKEMGKQARINSERFKIETISKQWEKLFNELVCIK